MYTRDSSLTHGFYMVLYQTPALHSPGDPHMLKGGALMIANACAGHLIATEKLAGETWWVRYFIASCERLMTVIYNSSL